MQLLAGKDPWPVVIVFVYCGWFVVLFSATLRRFVGFVRRVLRNKAEANAVAAYMRGLWRNLGCSAVADGADPEVEEQVHEILSERCVHLARGLAIPFCAIAARRSVSFAMEAATGCPSQLALVRSAAYLSTFSGLSICSLFPRLLSSRSLVAWQLFLMGSWSLATNPVLVPWGVAVSMQQQMASIGGLALGFMCLKVRFLVTLSLCQSIVWISCAMSMSDPDTALRLEDVLAMEFVGLGLKLSLYCFVSTLLGQSVRREVEARIGACERSAVSSLLGMMCDAVVELDQGLALKEHAPSLAGMLMHGPGISLRGRQFSDLIVIGEDQRRFEEAVANGVRDSDGSLPSSMLSLDVRDAIGNTIHMVLYHVPYLNLAGRMHHLVGLREDTDAGRGEMQLEAARAPTILGRAAMPEAVLKEDIRVVLPMQREAPHSRGSSRSRARASGRNSSSRSRSSSSNSGDDDDDNALVVEAWATSSLTISRVSRGFSHKFDAVQTPWKEQSFRSFLSPRDGEQLARWICEKAGGVAAGTCDPFIGVFGEAELAFGGGLLAARWKLEVCFPKLHPEFRRRQTYLVGIRLHELVQCGRGTARDLPARAFVDATPCSPLPPRTSL